MIEMDYEEAWNIGRDIAKPESDKLSRDAITLMIADTLAGEKPEKMVVFFQNWDVPLDLFVQLATKVEPELERRGHGGLLAPLKAAFGKAMMDGTGTERPQ